MQKLSLEHKLSIGSIDFIDRAERLMNVSDVELICLIYLEVAQSISGLTGDSYSTSPQGGPQDRE